MCSTQTLVKIYNTAVPGVGMVEQIKWLFTIQNLNTLNSGLWFLWFLGVQFSDDYCIEMAVFYVFSGFWVFGVWMITVVKFYDFSGFLHRSWLSNPTSIHNQWKVINSLYVAFLRKLHRLNSPVVTAFCFVASKSSLSIFKPNFNTRSIQLQYILTF